MRERIIREDEHELTFNVTVPKGTQVYQDTVYAKPPAPFKPVARRTFAARDIVVTVRISQSLLRRQAIRAILNQTHCSKGGAIQTRVCEPTFEVYTAEDRT